MQTRRIIGIGLLFSVTLLLFLVIYRHTGSNADQPAAQHGVIDLTGWSFHEQGFVQLDGEWEFYEGQLLESDDFREGIRKGVFYRSVPGTWKGKTEEGGMSRKGVGTYRLKVRLGDRDEVLALKVTSIRMSHRLFIDGKPEGASGVPAVVPAEHRPGNTPYTAFFKAENPEIEIIIQVANHVFVTGGIVNSIQLGSHQDIVQLNGIQLGSDMGVILMLVMFGAYQIGFHFVRRRERSYLLIGLYMFALSLGQALQGEKILQRSLPQMPFELAYKLLDLSQFLSAIIIILFLYTVDTRLMSLRKLMVVLAPLALYAASVLLLPYGIHIQAKYAGVSYMGVAVLFIIGRMIYLYLRSSNGMSNRKELLLFIGGSLSLLVFLTNGALYAENMASSDMAGKLGIICFIIFMNMLLVVRFSDAHTRTDILAHQLDQAQIKPHFLYNALSSVISFCYTDGEKAAHLLSMLSHYLRYILELDRSQLFVPLYRELELIHAYAEIEKARFDDRFELECRVEESLRHRNIPSLSIQPLIENAIRHGLFEKEGFGKVILTVRKNDNGILIIVEDDGVGMSAERLGQISGRAGSGGGIGVANIRSRLESIHGASWSISSAPGAGTKVTMRVPLTLEQETWRRRD